MCVLALTSTFSWLLRHAHMRKKLIVYKDFVYEERDHLHKLTNICRFWQEFCTTTLRRIAIYFILVIDNYLWRNIGEERIN